MSHAKLFIVKSSEILALRLLATTTAAACFRPWVEHGDPLPTFRRGLVVDYEFLLDGSFTDNGGAKILAMLGLMIVLTFYAPRFPRRWPTYLLGFGVALSGFSAYELARVWLWQRRLAGVIGAPVLMLGLQVVVAGSVLILLVALRRYLSCRTSYSMGFPGSATAAAAGARRVPKIGKRI